MGLPGWEVSRVWEEGTDPGCCSGIPEEALPSPRNTIKLSWEEERKQLTFGLLAKLEIQSLEFSQMKRTCPFPLPSYFFFIFFKLISVFIIMLALQLLGG